MMDVLLLWLMLSGMITLVLLANIRAGSVVHFLDYFAKKDTGGTRHFKLWAILAMLSLSPWLIALLVFRFLWKVVLMRTMFTVEDNKRP